MKRVEIYTTPSCPFCIRAKGLLSRKGVTFEETDVSADRSAMMARAGGRRTVPQIFIGGDLIGGCDDLHALEASGKLDKILAE